jgi:uncharacterized metal-binding protein
MLLRPLPVLFACQGCPQFGDRAHEVAVVLDRQGLAEAAWLGAPGRDELQLASKARSRFPVFAIDGCARRCACEWLAAHGAKAQRLFVLAAPGDSAESIAERIGERLANGG